MKHVFRRLAKAARLSVVPLYRRALSKGVGAAIEHEALVAFLVQKGLGDVVDLGANGGQFSLLCRQWLPRATIFAFEPLQRPADRFRKVFEGDPKTRLIQSAVGAVSGELEMHVSKAVDSSSLLPIGRIQSEVFPGTEESHREAVPVAPLDTFLDGKAIAENSLLKIDVQGYELEVLKGCESLLSRFSAVYVECSFVELYEGQALTHEVIEWLHERRFFLARVGGIAYDKLGVSVQGDFLFLHLQGK